MAIVNNNYPNQNELSDAELKQLAIQNMQRQEVQSTGFPTEIISLPSKGLVYSDNNPLREGQIEMKYMTAREEDILTSQNLIKQGVVLDKLMQSMIVSAVKYNDIIVGDKNAIMIAARILGYGKDYEVEITCPKCDAKTKETIDLTQMPTKNISESANMIAPNVFEFILPQSKRVVTFKLLTQGDEKKIQYELDSINKTMKKDSVNKELTTRLKHVILSIDGNTDNNAVRHFVDNELFAVDSKSLRSHIKEIAPDQNFEASFECSTCGHEEEALAFTIDTSFFWPKS